jgi:hypothetical protein
MNSTRDKLPVVLGSARLLVSVKEQHSTNQQYQEKEKRMGKSIVHVIVGLLMSTFAYDVIVGLLMSTFAYAAVLFLGIAIGYQLGFPFDYNQAMQIGLSFLAYNLIAGAIGGFVGGETNGYNGSLVGGVVAGALAAVVRLLYVYYS